MEKGQRMTNLISYIFNENLTDFSGTFLSLISLTLRSERSHNIAFGILENYRQIKPIDPQTCAVLKRAKKFLNNLFTSNDILGVALKVYELFNVDEDNASKELLDSKMTEELINKLYFGSYKYIGEDVYLLPENKGWGGLATCDGTIAICGRFRSDGTKESFR